MVYDLVIIGGGPAGLMAACRASELGAKVIILEKNKKPGVKLLTTGGGRCNFTNNILDAKILAENYEPNHRFLISAFSRFGVGETISFFNKNGAKTKIENNGRVFPESNRATDILQALLDNFKKDGGEIKFGAEVKKIIVAGGKIDKVVLSNGENILGKKYLMATGGKSYPLTGSSGEAYEWLKRIGHKIIIPRPALVSLQLKERFTKDLEGLSLPDVKIALWENSKKIASSHGAIIFTQTGISGPAALDISRFINLSPANKYDIFIDLRPDESESELNKYLQELFHSGNKLFKNILDKIVPPKLAPILMSLLKINPDKQANAVTKEEKNRLINILKKFPFTLNGLGDFDSAMVTAGGVDLSEVNPKTMASKLISNLYFAGEILDLTGPTGGFNLQLCWSTGYIAGESAIDKNIHS